MDINWAALYEKCFISVVKNDIEDLIVSSHEIMQLPVIIADADLNYLGMAPNSELDDYLWDRAYFDKCVYLEEAICMEQDNVLSLIIEHDKPMYMDWGMFKKYPRMFCSIRGSAGEILGALVILCAKGKFKQDYLIAADIVKKAAAVILENMQVKSFAKSEFFSIFTRELFSGNIKDQSHLKTWEKAAKCKIMPPFWYLALQARIKGNYFVLKTLKKNISSIYPSIFCDFYDDCLIVFGHSNIKIPSQDIWCDILNHVQKYDICIGASMVFEDIALSHDHQRQCKEALHIGKLLDKGNSFFNFSDYVLPIIISHATLDDKSGIYLHPAIQKLKAYDNIYGTEYLLTLNSYIKNLRDSNLAAKELFIHRNTLLYRVNKIEEITRVDLSESNSFAWLLCSMYIQMLSKSMVEDIGSQSYGVEMIKGM